MVDKLVEKLVGVLCCISYTAGRIQAFVVCAFYAIPLLWEVYKTGRRIQKCSCFSEKEIDDISERLIEKYQMKIDKALGL